MHRDTLSIFVGDLNCGFQLLKCKSLESRNVLIAASRAVYFDHIYSGGDFLSDDPHNLGNAVGAARVGRNGSGTLRGRAYMQAITGDEHSWSNHSAGVDKVAHRDI